VSGHHAHVALALERGRAGRGQPLLDVEDLPLGGVIEPRQQRDAARVERLAALADHHVAARDRLQQWRPLLVARAAAEPVVERAEAPAHLSTCDVIDAAEIIEHLIGRYAGVVRIGFVAAIKEAAPTLGLHNAQAMAEAARAFSAAALSLASLSPNNRPSGTFSRRRTTDSVAASCSSSRERATPARSTRIRSPLRTVF
jgi:hypothetical protein